MRLCAYTTLLTANTATLTLLLLLLLLLRLLLLLLLVTPHPGVCWRHAVQLQP
jgi:hypothetical protein